MKFLFNEMSEKGHPNEPCLCSTQKYGVIPQSMYENRVVVVNKGLENLKFVRKGNFVISLRSFQGGIEMAHYQGIISAAYTVLALGSSQLFDMYIMYLFKSHSFIQLLQTCVTGIREGQNINYDLLRKQFLPIPSVQEQHSIVSYLNDKVAKIDKYIAVAEKKIKALEELKQTIISDAVTHGINPNVKMKDSGIKWIGMVPEHWQVKKIRNYFTERRIKVSDKDYAPLSVAKIGIVPQLDDACKTDNGDNRKLVKAGDFVVNSRSDRKGSCGVSEFDGSVSLINIVLEPRNVNKGFIHFLFRSNNYIEEYYRNGRGIVADLWTTRYSEMKNISIPIPPLDEQQSIVSYIDRKISQIEQLRTKELSQIEKLKEYKQRLISDVVTGKVKVTND